MAMGGKATAIDVICGLKRRVDCGQYAPWLPSKLDEGLSKDVERTLSLLLNMLLAPVPDEEEQPFDELGACMSAIKVALYELENLLDDLDEHGSVRRRPGRPTWKNNNDVFKLHQHTNPKHGKYKEMIGFEGATIIGRDTEKQDLKDFLSQSNPDDLSILPIVGLPGLGKTSLARLVFEDKEEGWDFDLRIWIHVDENFDLEKFAVCIISEANKLMKGKFSHILKRSDCPSYLKFKDCIEEILSSSSCLIVLDDLLYANRHWLPDLKYVLGEIKHKCTRFIVTTSSEEVAEMMHTVPSYKLGGLSEDDCWTLFSEKAFGSRDAKIHSWQTKIGKAIVKRCVGMPILAQSLGLMVHNQDMDIWLAAGNDELWELVERHSLETEVFSSFKQIYYNMSLMSKSCFLYLSVFPRGSDIDKDELIRQWIALDLINSNRILPAFLLGEMFIKALVSISFLQIVNTSLVTEKKCKNPPPTILKVHSLVYDFLRYIAADDIFTLDYAKSPNVCVRNLPFRYAVLTNYSWQATMHEDLIAKAKVAKAAIFRNCEATMPIADIFSILRYSRLLDLSGCLFQQLPTSIGEMKHLRYLNISCFRITELPNEMCCLRSLEYLDLSKTCIKVLPLFVGTFNNLKYFNLRGCGKLKNLPRNLGDLKRLEHLNLSCCPEIGELPSSISGLRELKSLNLSSCTKLELLPHQFGNLSRLETLELARCCNLQRLPESFGGLSKLCYLSLASCSRLQGLPDCIGELCSLEYLNISHVHLELPDSLSKLQSLHVVNS
uniref:Uncharacterized protein n=1 Tax=Oryza punctata TaxID=4537 RepID=A0A0E0LZX6_ORYPU